MFPPWTVSAIDWLFLLECFHTAMSLCSPLKMKTCHLQLVPVRIRKILFQTASAPTIETIPAFSGCMFSLTTTAIFFFSKSLCRLWLLGTTLVRPISTSVFAYWCWQSLSTFAVYSRLLEIHF